MALAADVSVCTPEQQRNIKLVARYAGVEDRIAISHGAELRLQSTAGDLQLHGLNTICRFIAGLSGRKGQLLGADEASRRQVSEWLSYRNTSLAPITEDKLGMMTTHLLSRTFLLGIHLSLADLCLFASLHRALVSLPPSQANRFSSLFRWYDHMQHVSGAAGLFKALDFQKSPLPPVPSALPPKAQSNSKEKAPSGDSGAASAVSKAAPASEVKASKDQKVGAEVPGKATTGPAVAASKEAVSTSSALPPVAPKSGEPVISVYPKTPRDAKKAKKEARKEALKQAEAAKKQEEDVRIDMLDIRVGQIAEIAEHPNADGLYVEQIDFGDGKPRQVVSGLRNFVSKDQMMGRMVVVCLNLKPAKMRDVMSYGMVLCASTHAHDKVDPLTPPAGAQLGQRVTVPGYSNEPLAEVNPKKKIVEKLKDDLLTDSIGIATYKANPFMCSTGPVTSNIPNGLVG